MLNLVGKECFFFLLSSGYLQGIFGINGGREKWLWWGGWLLMNFKNSLDSLVSCLDIIGCYN